MQADRRAGRFIQKVVAISDLIRKSTLCVNDNHTRRCPSSQRTAHRHRDKILSSHQVAVRQVRQRS